jgi:hypothetical protein
MLQHIKRHVALTDSDMVDVLTATQQLVDVCCRGRVENHYSKLSTYLSSDIQVLIKLR